MVIRSDRNAVLRANRNQDIRLDAAKRTGRLNACHAAMRLSGLPVWRTNRIAGLTHQGCGPADRSPASPSCRNAVTLEGGCPGRALSRNNDHRSRPDLSMKRTARRFSGVTGIWQDGCSVKPANRPTVVRHGGVSAIPDSCFAVGRRMTYGPTLVRSDRQSTPRFSSWPGTQSDRRTGYRSACAQGRQTAFRFHRMTQRRSSRNAGPPQNGCR